VFFYLDSAVEPRSHALIRAEVAVVLMAVTVLETTGLDALLSSKSLLTCVALGDDHGFAPALEVSCCSGNLLRNLLLYSLRAEMKEDLDSVGSPVLRLLAALLHSVGAGELVPEP